MEELPDTDSSREGPIEDQVGNSCANSWRLEVCGNTHPSKPKIAEFSQQYRKTCPTHHKLVKSGQLRCSVSLSDSPVSNLDLPSAPTSPQPTYHNLQGSVHWGAVGDLSGTQTPNTSLEAFSGEGLPPPPPRRFASVLSPSLLDGVVSILKDIPTEKDTDQLTPVKPVGETCKPGRPNFSYKIPIVSTDISSIESYPYTPVVNELALLPEVFESPISNTSYNNKMSEIKDQFIQEQKALNNKRRRLIREVNEFPESDIPESY